MRYFDPLGLTRLPYARNPREWRIWFGSLARIGDSLRYIDLPPEHPARHHWNRMMTRILEFWLEEVGKLANSLETALEAVPEPYRDEERRRMEGELTELLDMGRDWSRKLGIEAPYYR